MTTLIFASRGTTGLIQGTPEAAEGYFQATEQRQKLVRYCPTFGEEPSTILKMSGFFPGDHPIATAVTT